MRALTCVFLLAGALVAQSVDDELGSDLDFFDEVLDQSPVVESSAQSEQAKSPWALSLTNRIVNRAAVNTAQPSEQPNFVGVTWLDSEWQGDLELRYQTLLRLLVDWKAHLNLAYTLRGRGHYRDDFLADNEKDASFRRALLQFSPTSWLTAEAGAEIMRWGRSDMISVLDVLNPVDGRNLPPVLVSLNDVKQPLLLGGLRLQRWDWRLSGHALLAGDGNLYPLPGSEWAAEGPNIPVKNPPLSDVDLAVSLDHYGSVVDFSLYYALFDEKTPYLRQVFFPGVSAGELAYARVHLFGAAASLALGDWVFKGEAGWSTGHRSFPKVDDSISKLAVMLGLDFYFPWFEDSYLTLEANFKNYFGYDEDGLTIPYNPLPQSVDLAANLHWSFDERLPWGVEAQLLSRALFKDGGQVRMGLFMRPVDPWKLSLGYAHYLKGETPTSKEFDRASKIYLNSELAVSSSL